MDEIFWIRSFVQKFWQMISKSRQLISICSTDNNKELQGLHIEGSSSFRS